MMTVRENLYDTIHRSKKPLKVIAEEIGISETYLTRAALPDQEDSDTGTGCRFPLKKLVPLILATNNYSVLDAIEQSVGRFGVPLPPSNGTPTADMAKLTIKTISDFSKLMNEVGSAVQDGKITSLEITKIKKEGYRAAQAVLSLVAACEGNL